MFVSVTCAADKFRFLTEDHFLREGYLWGRLMQDDIQDGVIVESAIILRQIQLPGAIRAC